jgi:hypothetical protein
MVYQDACNHSQQTKINQSLTAFTFTLLYFPNLESHLALCTPQRHAFQIRRVGGHTQDPERVGVAQSSLPALDGNDRRARLDDLELERTAQAEPNPVVHIQLPLRRLDAARFGVPERIAAPVQVDLPRGLLVARD